MHCYAACHSSSNRGNYCYLHPPLPHLTEPLVHDLHCTDRFDELSSSTSSVATTWYSINFYIDSSKAKGAGFVTIQLCRHPYRLFSCFSCSCLPPNFMLLQAGRFVLHFRPTIFSVKHAAVGL
jgi:hypothetical protein